jgi:methionine-rich copper-binding protein CopC
MSDTQSAPRARCDRGKTLIMALTVAVASLPWSGCWARPMSVLESFPMVDQIMDGTATSFSIRFDGPVNHATSRLTLVTPHGARALHARLDSEPNTLFTGVGILPSGSYELRWEARAMDGEVSKGAIPFKVSVK